MQTLTRDLRRSLENTVRDARRIAETGAAKVIEQLAVPHHEPWPSMTPEQRKLRNALRAHGRQLGDRRDERRGEQAIDRLTTECAYEHWHRMLFARFLAETNLLIEPESGMDITLEDCRELARERGEDWLELASLFAQRMLPEIFRNSDPVLKVALPPETRSELENLLKALPRDVFVADDSLGWVYQYWQADRKEEVNRSEKKIGADELPAVTQLFTEDYMVFFLLLSAAVGRNQNKKCRYRWKPGTARLSDHLWITFAQKWQLLRSNCITRWGRGGQARYWQLIRNSRVRGRLRTNCKPPVLWAAWNGLIYDSCKMATDGGGRRRAPMRVGRRRPRTLR